MLNRVLLIAIGFQTMMMMTRPIITLYASELGADTFAIGILTATFAFLPLIFAVHAGKLADHIGDRLPVLFGMIGCASGMALPYLFPSIEALYVSQVIVGVSHVIINLSLQNVLGNAATNENRDHYFGMLSMMVAIAAFIGPIAGGYLSEHFSYSFVFLVASLLSIGPIYLALSIPVILHHKEGGKQVGSSSLGLLKMPELRNALISSALVLYSRDIFVAYFPLYAQQIDLSDFMIGWIIAIQGLAMVPVRLYLSKLAAAMGRQRLLWASILVAGVSFLLVPVLGQVYMLVLLSALMGLGLGCGQPLSMTTIYNASPRQRSGEVLGLRLATNRLSQLIAPLFFGIIGNWVGVVSVFYVSGAFLIGGAFLTKTDPTEKHGENS